jgi:hypothetical protein
MALAACPLPGAVGLGQSKVARQDYRRHEPDLRRSERLDA